MGGWNGSGSVTLDYDWTDDRDASVPIDADRMDAQQEDIRAAIQACLAKNGENAMTGDLDLNGNALVLDADADTKIDAATDDQIDFNIGGSDRMSLSDGALTLTMSDSRTNTVDVPVVVRSVTTGTPAAGIGTGLQFDAESGDENPSTLGRLDLAFSDVSAGSEDSYLSVLLRTAGAAAAERYRLQATAANNAIFTHANSADRTYTLPDATDTLVGRATTDTLTNKTVSNADNTLTFANAQTFSGQLTNSISGGAATPAFKRTDAHGTGVSIFQADFTGKDDGGAEEVYARMGVWVDDDTNGSEDSHIYFQTHTAGTLTNRVRIYNGLVMNGATGGDQGAGTINATAIYKNGTEISSGLTFVTSTTPSAANAVDFESGFGNDDAAMLFVLDNVSPATDGVDLFLRVKDAGAYQSDAGDYRYTVQINDNSGAGGTDVNGSQSATEINMTDGLAVGSDTGEVVSGLVWVIAPTTGNKVRIQWELAYRYTDGRDVHAHGMGEFTTSAAIEGIRFMWESSANFDASGEIHQLRLKAS